MSEWADWESGDALVARDGQVPWQLAELVSKIANRFGRIVIDWTEGSRWVEARIEKAIQLALPPQLVDAEKGLLGLTALITVTDCQRPGSPIVKFFFGPDASLLELHYEPSGSEEQCRIIASRLAECLQYDLDAL